MKYLLLPLQSAATADEAVDVAVGVSICVICEICG
jgi:hypothetical protein